MKLSIGIAVFNQIEDTKKCWGSIVASTTDKDQIELVVIDNGCTDNTVEFLERFVFPHFPNHKLIQNPENVGVVKALDQIYKESTGDVIVMPHNDVYIYEYNWNKKVMDEFEKDPKLGMAGFLGAVGLTQNGGRHITMSNMLEAEIHGNRITEATECVTFDGLCMIFRRTMLDEVGGFDLGYQYHHAYDRDISITSYHAGWTNKVIPVYCHHISGVTANRPDWGKQAAQIMGVEEGKGDLAIYQQSMTRFEQKWAHYLPKQLGEARVCPVHQIPTK